LLAFNPPRFANQSFATQDAYISHQTPNATPPDIKTILTIPAPPSTLLQDLVACLASTHALTTGSLACQDLRSTETNYFPLWLLTYWIEVNRIIRIQDCWSKADRSLKRLSKGPEEVQELVEQVYNALDNLPWSGLTRGFTDATDITNLHKFATSAWLGGENKEQMLDLLRCDVLNYSNDSTRIRVEHTHFTRSLSRAFSRRQARPRKGYLHRTGQLLASGVMTHVACIANYKDVHWVALVIDFMTKSIWYGDSLGWKLEADLGEVLEWWISGYSEVTFTYRTLPITHQSDTHSCGLLAWNSLAHFLLPERHPLMDPASIQTERLHMLLRICEHQRKTGLVASSTHMEYSFPPLLPDTTPDSDSDIEMHLPSKGSSTCNESSSSSEASTNLDESDDENPTSDDDNPTKPQITPRPAIDHGKPKIQIQSSLRSALQTSTKKGLLAFFKPCTREEYNLNLAREKEKWEEENHMNAWEVKEQSAKEARLAEKRELARLRQQRLRQKKHQEEILQGIRSPHGRKRTVRGC
jgi:hypothetical protein